MTNRKINLIDPSLNSFATKKITTSKQNKKTGKQNVQKPSGYNHNQSNHHSQMHRSKTIWLQS